ncbi:MAG: hypothetical protein AB7T06_02030 [Kofleriaceae bacterium]
MAGIPVRLSAQLTERAKRVASMQDRSLTEQVEHWARLGQLVEESVSAATVLRLKARSYGQAVDEALEAADSPEGRARALALIESRNPVRYGIGRNGKLVKVTSKRRSAAKR